MRKPTRTERVIKAIQTQISNRSLEPGDKLASIRKMARILGVSNSTVVEGYDRLAADNVIYAKRGSGYFVSASTPPLKIAEIGPKLDQAIDPFWVSRQSLDAKADTLMPGCGWLPSSWMPQDEIRKALRKLARSEDALLSNYGRTKGSSNLRRWLSRQGVKEGLTIDPECILLTSSGTQSIDLICRLFLKPGDCVLVDDPCYFNFQALLKAHQVKIIGVPFGEDGPDLQTFKACLTQYAPRLYLTNSALHNPTGATISVQTAHKLVTAATAHNVVIVEDDIFSDFEPDPSVRMAVMDGLEQVIRIGSFSKTLSASMRCGYIAAKPDWIEALTDLQVATNFGGPSPLSSEAIYLVLSGSGFGRHMQALQKRLEHERMRASEQLCALGFKIVNRPRGGFYLWCELPDKCDATKIAKRALKQGVVLAPGNVFSPSQSKSNFMRFNVSQMHEKVFLTLKDELLNFRLEARD